MKIYVTIFVLLFVGMANAHTVTANFAFGINGTRDNNTIRVNDMEFAGTDIIDEYFYNTGKKYISGQSNNVVGFLVSKSVENFWIRLKTAFSLTGYLFQMNDHEKNKFIIGYTTGNWTSIEDRLPEKIPAGTMSGSTKTPSGSFLYFVRLDYTSANIVSDARIDGTKTLLIKNEGADEAGRQSINISVIP